MSVPGQTVQGTFGVQHLDREQEFLCVTVERREVRGIS